MRIYICMYWERERDGESTLNLDIIWTSYSWTLNQYQLMNMNIISTMHDCIYIYIHDIFFNRPMFVDFSILLLSFTGRNGAMGPVFDPHPRQPSGRQSRSQMHVPAARPSYSYGIVFIWYHIDTVSRNVNLHINYTYETHLRSALMMRSYELQCLLWQNQHISMWYQRYRRLTVGDLPCTTAGWRCWYFKDTSHAQSHVVSRSFLWSSACL